MINKMAQKYLERKGYVAVKKSTIDYAISVTDVAAREIRTHSIDTYKLISDLLAVKYRLKYYRLE